jgi:hypothetical protein
MSVFSLQGKALQLILTQPITLDFSLQGKDLQTNLDATHYMSLSFFFRGKEKFLQPILTAPTYITIFLLQRKASQPTFALPF